MTTWAPVGAIIPLSPTQTRIWSAWSSIITSVSGTHGRLNNSQERWGKAVCGVKSGHSNVVRRVSHFWLRQELKESQWMSVCVSEGWEYEESIVGEKKKGLYLCIFVKAIILILMESGEYQDDRNGPCHKAENEYKRVSQPRQNNWDLFMQILPHQKKVDVYLCAWPVSWGSWKEIVNICEQISLVSKIRAGCIMFIFLCNVYLNLFDNVNRI